MANTRAYIVWIAAFAMTALAASTADAQPCAYPYGPTGPKICADDPPPAQCPGARNPYEQNLCSDETPVGSRQPEPEPMPDPEPPLWRLIPPAPAGEPLSTIVEQGPAYPLETYALRGPVPAFAWYAPSTGLAFIVVDGVWLPERVCVLDDIPPGLNIVVLDLDVDGQEDLLAHDPITGKVYRYYVRDLSVCQ